MYPETTQKLGENQEDSISAGSKRKLADCFEHWMSDEEEQEPNTEPESFTKYYRFHDEEPTSDVDYALPKGPIAKTIYACQLSLDCAYLPDFSSLAEYKLHCRECHHHECFVCRRILPTAKLLDLHISELHDSFFATLAESENAYECFVDGCNRKCSGPFKRKRHLVDKHHFPSNFNILIILGKGGKQWRKKGPSFRKEPALVADDIPEAELTNADVGNQEISAQEPSFDEMVESMKRLQFVPRAVALARNKNRLLKDSPDEGEASPSIAMENVVAEITENIKTTSELCGSPWVDVIRSPAVQSVPLQIQETVAVHSDKLEGTPLSGGLSRRPFGPKVHSHQKSSNVWSHRMALNAYLSSIPNRAKEAEKAWKETRKIAME